MTSNQRRLSGQQEQEYISRDQLATRLDEYGWVPDPVFRDLGEDFIVRIFDKGVSSGLAFWVQLKSTQDLDLFKIRGGYISYRVEVVDLKYWETSAIPVFIIIWDTNRKIGCWISVTDAITELDNRRPIWRRQKTVRVRIPYSNETSDAGFRQIRKIVAYHYYPTISRGKSIEIEAKFVFPETPEGQTARRAFEQHFAAGDIAEIDGQFIQELKFSEWWTRLFGKIDPSQGRLVLGPGKSEQPVPARLDLTSQDGVSASVPYVDLRILKRGSNEITLSNEGQQIPLQFLFVFREPDHHFRMTFRVTGPGTNVCDTRDLVSFLDTIARGCKLRITFLETQHTFEPELPGGHIDVPHPEFVSIVDNLCMIQQKTGCTLALDSDWSLADGEIQTINELVEIFKTGRVVKHNAILTGNFRKAALDLMLEVHRTGKPISLRLEGDDSWMELLGIKIPLGPYREHISGVLDISVAELERAIADMEAKDELEVRFVEAQVVEEFTDWLQEDAAVSDIHEVEDQEDDQHDGGTNGSTKENT